MKKVLNQKWILSAFLIAALGSQYYYSVSSQQLLSSDFASTAEISPDDINVPAAPVVPASTEVKGATTTINVDSGAATTNNTQGVAVKEECKDCEILRLSHTEADALRNLLKTVNAPATPVAAAPTAAAKPAPADDSPEAICADERSEAAKSICIRREKANAKKAEDDDAMLLRGQEFEDKMADYADRYPNNLETLNSRFQSLLRSYSGRKKISPDVAKNVFAKYIEPLLRQKLNASTGSPEDIAALHDLVLGISNGLPAEYRSINNLMAQDIKKAAEVRAAAVHDSMTEARQAYTDKDYIHSQELWTQADQSRKRLLAEYNGNAQYGITGYFDMLSNNLQGSDDQSNANLIPSVRNLFTQMNNESQNFLNINTNGSNDPNASGRAGRGTTVTTSPSAPINTNNVGPALPNVSFGNQSQTQTGSRAARR